MTVAGLLACLVLASFPSQPIVGTVDFVAKTFYRLTVAGTALDFNKIPILILIRQLADQKP